MIAGILAVKDEADIVGLSVRHMFAQGIDRLWVYDGMSTDGTRDILADVAREHPVEVFDDAERYFFQKLRMNELAAMAGEAGAEWVVPFDADEFFVAPGTTVAGLLASLPCDVTKVYAAMFQYLNLEWREPEAKPLPKVVFRWSPVAVLALGNHDVQLPGESARGRLEVREVQYRSFDHFCRKIADRNETIDPSLPPSEGTHIRQYAGWSRDDLLPVWGAMRVRATVYDPIPVGVHR